MAQAGTIGIVIGLHLSFKLCFRQCRRVLYCCDSCHLVLLPSLGFSYVHLATSGITCWEVFYYLFFPPVLPFISERFAVVSQGCLACICPLLASSPPNWVEESRVNHNPHSLIRDCLLLLRRPSFPVLPPGVNIPPGSPLTNGHRFTCLTKDHGVIWCGPCLTLPPNFQQCRAICLFLWNF